MAYQQAGPIEPVADQEDFELRDTRTAAWSLITPPPCLVVLNPVVWTLLASSPDLAAARTVKRTLKSSPRANDAQGFVVLH